MRILSCLQIKWQLAQVIHLIWKRYRYDWVLNVFKRIHKVRKEAFEEDYRMLAIIRNKINEEFKKNKNVADPEKIQELLRTAEDTEAVMRLHLVQVEHREGNIQRLKIRESTEKIKHSPFDPNFVPDPDFIGQPCCSNASEKQPDGMQPDDTKT